MVWIIICGLLTILVQAGFGLLDTGLCRAKNAAHTMCTSFLVYAMSVTGFFICGFALSGTAAGGGPANIGITAPGGDWLFIGKAGFFLSGVSQDSHAMGQFVCILAFMAISASISAGALAERWSVKSFMLMGLLAGAIICPVYACWVWGGGWLTQLGGKLGMGHGVVDFAGSGAMHLQGGAIAFIAALMLGPRIGKYDSDGRPRAILGHHLPMVFLGTFILAVGWFGLTTGAALGAAESRLGIVAANCVLAAVAGTLASASYMWFRFGKPDPSMMCNGMLAGLVAIAGPCAFVQPWAAFFIGLVAGLVVVLSIFFWEKIGVDDPIGAISIHGVCGAWGLLALGLFADGTYGTGWNGVDGAVKGLFYGGGRQFLAQLIGVGAGIAWPALAGGLAFWAIGRTVGNRVPAAVEIAGLDIPETGAPGYPEFIEHMTPEMISRSDIAAAEAALAVYGVNRPARARRAEAV